VRVRGVKGGKGGIIYPLGLEGEVHPSRIKSVNTIR
jgi:hypothetical protein